MTCAFVVNGALKKVAGVESVEVSLNKGLATVKLKPGNTVTVRQLWNLIRDKGYTPKATTISARGEISGSLFQVSGGKETFPLQGERSEATGLKGQIVTVRGVLTPGKDLQARVPLQVTQLQ